MALSEDTIQKEQAIDPHMSQLLETIEYLQTISIEDLNATQYREIEEAILKVWVWSTLRGFIASDLGDIFASVQSSLLDFRGVIQGVDQHGIRSRKHQSGRRTRAFTRI